MSPAGRLRYAVQRSGKGRWKTVRVEADCRGAEAAFEQMLEANPRGYFRVIELRPRADSASGQREFDWKLIALYDPKRGRVVPPSGEASRQQTQPVRIPVRLYALAILTGLVAGAVALVVWGPWRGG